MLATPLSQHEEDTLDCISHLSADEKRAICDVRLSAIAREAYSNLLTGRAFLAMGKDSEAASYMAEVESLSLAYAEIRSESARWEATSGDDR